MKTLNKLLLAGMLFSNLNSSPVYSNNYCPSLSGDVSGTSKDCNKGNIKSGDSDARTNLYFLTSLCVAGLLGFIYEKTRKKRS